MDGSLLLIKGVWAVNVVTEEEAQVFVLEMDLASLVRAVAMSEDSFLVVCWLQEFS